jgi:hypothetical protein
MMKIITEKYITNYEESGYDLLQKFLFNKLLISKRVVSPLRKYLSKSDCKATNIW